MIDLSLLPDGGVGWLDASGPESHLVLSTRIRLARNLAGHLFQTRNTDGERERILEVVERAARESVLLRRAVPFRLDQMERTDRQLLHERHLVSKELAALEAEARPRSGASVLIGDRLGVMVNEEDHLRLQGLRSGFALEAAYAEVERLDAELGQRLPFAFHPEFGYLTSCPTNVGTGLRASVLIHLPGLVLTKEISKVLQGLAQVGLTFRGLYGEGSEVVGNFFQLSNQTTLGKSEHELLDHLGKHGAAGDRVRGAGAAGAAARCAGDHRGQGVARVRAAALRPDPVVRRGHEPPQRRAAGRGDGADPRTSGCTRSTSCWSTRSRRTSAVAQGSGRAIRSLPVRRARQYVRRVLEEEVGRRGA